ncbi:30S ribosome-binding factor RbfA [Phragmitibacter flavus]|nr:30S ribosome-binding factor RbfA [Phragmitibacter flavus]
MNHRLLRVKELIRRELGTIMERHVTFPGALVTIHDVDITPDLKQCFIFVGVLGGEGDPREAVYKLNDMRVTLQRELFKRVILKNSPTLHFKYDNSIERGVKILHAIENLPEPLPEGEYDDSRVMDDDDDVEKGDDKKS